LKKSASPKKRVTKKTGSTPKPKKGAKKAVKKA
jgi:hypothetical protein